jgi:peptidoglycan/xylan/chitin deacetylase (PgdA/CDA1 family)
MPGNTTKVSIFHLLDKSGTLVVDDFSLTLAGATSTPPTPPPATTTPPTQPPTAEQFAEGMVTLSFDDSWLSQYEQGLPILDQAGIKGTFYITTEPIENGWDGFITLTQLKDIALKGHELGGHTVTHADLATLRRARISSEIRNSKSFIQNQTGTIVTSLAYPYGSYNSTVITQAKQAGYTNARGVEEGLVKKNDDKYTLKSHSVGPTTALSTIRAYIDQAKANKQWYILTLHEIDNAGGEYSTSPQDLQAIVEYIKATGIKAVTMQQGVAAMGQ